MKQDKDCPLCKLVYENDVLTEVIQKTDKFILTYCVICRVPMAVLKEHRPSFTQQEKASIRAIFKNLLKKNQEPIFEPDNLEGIYGSEQFQPDFDGTIGWVIDWEQRKIPEHAHCHLRPKPFPDTSQWEKLLRD